jgi:hypothetical protein
MSSFGARACMILNVKMFENTLHIGVLGFGSVPSGLKKLIALEILDFSSCRVLKHVPEDWECSQVWKILACFSVRLWKCFPLD